jgi:hypothetical protein
MRQKNKATAKQTDETALVATETGLPASYATAQKATLDIVGRTIGVVTINQETGLFTESLSNAAFPEFDAVVIDTKVSRARFTGTTFSKGEKPVCRSLDSIISAEGDTCADCEYINKWEDKKPACPPTVNLLLWLISEQRPVILRARGSSFTPIKNYLSWLEQCRYSYPQAFVRFSLEEKSRGSNVYFVLKPETKEIIEDQKRFDEICRVGERFSGVFKSRDLDNENEAEAPESDVPF